MRHVLFAGERLFMKFGTLDYFRERLGSIGVGVSAAEGKSGNDLIGNDATAIVVIAHRVNGELLRSMSRCEFVMTLSVGYDCVDVQAASELKIPVSNCPAYCSEDVAEHAIALLLSLARKLHVTASRARAGEWGYAYAKPIRRYSTSRLGIIGFGKIGRRLAPKARALGIEVTAYDPYLADDIFGQFGVTRCYELAELLETSDFISVHAPLTGETDGLIGEAELELMKPNSILINTARGPIVDEFALYRALDAGRIAGAGIDVLSVEPPSADHPLLQCDRAIVTPHIAWYSEESFEANKIAGMDELVRVLTRQRPRHIVNPEIYGT